MNLNEIDQIVIKGMKEAEKRNEIAANEAKLRVWDTIDTPKNNKVVHWWLVSSIAAAVSLLLIASIIFLPLVPQKEENIASKIQIGHKIPQVFSNNEKSVHEEKQRLEHQVIDKNLPPEQASSALIESSKDDVVDLEEEGGKSAEILEILHIPSSKNMLALAKTTTNIPKKIHQQLVAKSALPKEERNETISETQPKQAIQLKFKIGNSTKPDRNQNALALSIKL